MKEYEHRQLESCVNMNVKSMRNTYSPSFGFCLSWSKAKDSLADIRSYNWGRTEMQQAMAPELRHIGELPPLSPRVHLLPPW